MHNNVNNYGNTKINNNLETNNLLVNNNSILKGNINIENNLKSKYYNFDYNNEKITINGLINLQKNVNINDNLTVYKNTNINNILETNKLIVNNNTNLKGNINIENNLNSKYYNFDYNNETVNINGLTNLKKDVNINHNLTVYGNTKINNILETNNLIVNNFCNLKETVNINNNLNVKKNINIDNSLIVKENGIFLNNLIVKNESILENKVKIKENLNLLKSLNVKENVNLEKEIKIKGNVIIDENLNIKNIICDKDGLFKENLIINKNLTVQGNIILNGTKTKINTINLDIEDPIITMANNINNSDKIYSGLLIKGKNNKYIGIIRNNNINEYNNLYILNNITNDNNINQENRTNLIVNNLNTSDISEFNGGLFKNKIYIPKYQDKNNIEIYNDLNIQQNLSVNDTFILLNTNSLNCKGSSLFTGTSIFDGHTILRGHVDYRNISTLSIDHLNVRSFINSETKLDTKSIDIQEELIMPVDPNKINATRGSIYYNSATSTFTGYDGEQWMYLGGQGTQDTYMSKDVYMQKNVYISTSDELEKGIYYQGVNINLFNDSNNLYVHNKSIFNGYVEMNNNLCVNNQTQLKKKVVIEGNLNVKENVNIDLDLNIKNNLNIGENIKINSGLKIPTSSNNILNEKGSIYYNNSSNLFMGYTNLGWRSLGGLNPYNDTIIQTNLNVNKNLNVIQNLNINGNISCNGTLEIDGTTNINNILYTKQLILPNNIQNINSNINSNIYIKHNSISNIDELKIRLNNRDNTIFLNSNPLSNLPISTDLFQFYNVMLNTELIGNRILGLNDPAFNTFSKYYVLQEYLFHEKCKINGLEIYVTENIQNNLTVKLQIKIFKNNILIETYITTNINDYITIKQTKLISFSNDYEFLKNDKVKITLTLLSKNDGSDNLVNGHEIFCRLFGTTLLYPEINTLELKSTSIKSLISAGGGIFTGPLQASSYGPFTGSHYATLITNLINNENYVKNNTNYFKEGLIVSIKETKNIDISNNEFIVKLSEHSYDKNILGVINKNIKNNIYMINALGEGSILVTNINGNIEKGDYICSSDINGYACRQNGDALMNYTIAKSCSNIEWNKLEKKISYKNQLYKIALCSCIYYCG